MTKPKHSLGFVYVLTNHMMPDLVKIGLTTALPEDRAKQLFDTGVPSSFDVAFRAITSRPDAVEKRTHQLLNSHRVNPKREFFRISVDDAISAIRCAQIDVAGISAWQSPNLHVLENEDRLALTLKINQAFALIAYKDFGSVMAGGADIFDLWQVHSDGDLLEIYATDSPGHVSGFSDGDPGSADDPVPFLNREATVTNEFVNGRERLMPGERLVWLPAPEDADTEEGVIFEPRSHCQVVSRSNSIQTGPEGLPLLLNVFTHTQIWPAAKRTIQQALALPIPRTWAPRHGRDSIWADVGSAPPSPEHWLPQLGRKRRKGK